MVQTLKKTLPDPSKAAKNSLPGGTAPQERLGRLLGWIFDLTSPQKAPRSGPRAAKTAPRIARTAPRAPQEPPRRPQESPAAPLEPPRRSLESPKASQMPLGASGDRFWNHFCLQVGHSGASLSISMPPPLLSFTTPPLNHSVSKKRGRRHGGGALKINSKTHPTL